MQKSYFESQLMGKAHLKAARLQSARVLKNYGSFIRGVKNGNVLDIGPGRGELLNLFEQKNGVSLYALDIDQEVVRNINETLPHVITHTGCPIEFLRSSNEEFELIFMLHVLEHLEKGYALRLLEQINESLSPMGRLIIEVPNNSSSFVGGSMQSSDYTHVSAYNSISLEQICNAASLEVIEVVGIRPKGNNPIRLLQRLLFSLLVTVDKIAHKILLPSWEFKHEPTIYVHCVKK